MAREFTGELDSTPPVREFDGPLDATIPTRAAAKKRNPSFLDQVSDTFNNLLGTGSVMDGMEGVTPAPATPQQTIQAAQGAQRVFDQHGAERAATSARRQALAKSSPVISAAASGSAKALQGTLDAIPLVADAFNRVAVNPVNRLVSDADIAPAQRLPFAADLQQAAQDYAPAITQTGLTDAWEQDQTGDWLAANLAQQAPQVAQSLGAALVPASRIPLLAGMGAQSAGNAYQQNKEAGIAPDRAIADAIARGEIEMLSEMLPLGVFDKIRDVMPKGATVLPRLMQTGAAIGAQSATGAIEESAAQLGGNVLDNAILNKATPLTDRVLDSAVLGAAGGTVLGAPHVLAAQPVMTPEQEIARAIEQAAQNTEFAVPAEQVARARMDQPRVREFTGQLDQAPAAQEAEESFGDRAVTAAAASPDNAGSLADTPVQTVPVLNTQDLASQPPSDAIETVEVPASSPAQNVQPPATLRPVSGQPPVEVVPTPDAPAFAQPDALNTEAAVQLDAAQSGMKPGDIVQSDGKPFKTKPLALKHAKEAGQYWRAVKGGGGFVVRHMPPTDRQIANGKRQARNAAVVDAEKDSLFAAIAKLGGIQPDQLTKQWGFDPKEISGIRGAGIKRVSNKNGTTLDRMAERLAEAGYLSYDENGRHDLEEFFELFDGELRGNKHYTPQGFENQARAMLEEEWLSQQLADELNALPEQGQDDIEEILDEYETSTEADEQSLARQADAFAGVDREDGEILDDARAEEGSNAGLDEAVAGAATRASAGQRADDAEPPASPRRIRDEIAAGGNLDADPDADIPFAPDDARLKSDAGSAADTARERARKKRQAVQRRYEQDADKNERDFQLRQIQKELDAELAQVDGVGDVPFSRRQTDTEAFRRWFGDSKVVNGNGDPLVMYRGSQHENAEGYDANSLIFLTSEKRFAENYGKNGKVFELFVKAEKPFDASRGNGYALWKEFVADTKAEGWASARSDRGALPFWTIEPQLREWLDAKGVDYDSIYFAESDGSSSLAVRDISQIKSATGNNGDFDASNPDITMSRSKSRDTGMTVEQVNSAIAADTFGHDVDVYADWSDVPHYIRMQASREEGGDVEGFWDTVKNKVALIASNLDSAERAKEVARHELIGHYGLENMLQDSADPDAMAKLIKRVIRAEDDGNAVIVDLAAQVDRTQPGLSDERRAKEIMAIMAERNIQNSIAKRVLDAIRVFLKKIGFVKGDITDAKIAALLRDAQKYLQAHNRGTLAEPQPVFSRAESELVDTNSNGQKIAYLRANLDNFWKWYGDGPTDEQGRPIVDGHLYTNDRGQQKSINNIGTFDPKQGSTLYSKKADSAFSATDPTTLDNIRRALQDNKIDLKRVQQAIQASGGTIAESDDAYLNEELYIGKVSAQLDKLVDKRVTPLLEAISKSGLTLSEVDDFLYARHAPEANARLQKLNPDSKNKALSGMSDEQAADIMAKFRANGKAEKLTRVAAIVDQITAETRKRIVANGLESADMIARWEAAYDFYVPLKADDDIALGMKASGFTVRGRESQRRLGQTGAASNILANVIAQAQSSIKRSEKAKVGRSLLDLARSHPNKDFWTVDKPVRKREVNPETGLLEWVIDKNFKEADNVLVVKENGEDHYIVFTQKNERAMKIAAAMQNLDAAQLPWVVEAAGKVTRHLAQWITARNPLFWITNFARDLQGAAFNLQNTPLAGQEAKVMAAIPKGMLGYWKITRGDGKGQWADYAKEFKASGAETGFVKVFETADDHMADLQQQFEQMQQGKADPRKLARSLVEAIDDYNTVIENGVRLAVYQTARESGLSVRKAASLAKNITVNFNRRGTQSTFFNALYMFMNANIQGNARFLSAVATSRRAQVVAGALVGIGFVLDAVNRAIGGEDEETGKAKYDLIPEFERERNWIFMSPSGQYVKIPMPYGPHLAMNAGRMLSDMAFGEKAEPVEKALSLARITVDAFNPLGSVGSFGQLIAPSALKPIVQVSENKSFAGGPVYRDDNPFGYSAPAYTRHFKSTGEHWTEASKLLNDLTGGDAIKPGQVDVPPEVLKTLVLSYVAPGIAQTVDKTATTAANAAAGKKVEPSQIPALSRFYGEAPEERSQERAFYEKQRKVKQLLTEHDKYLKDGQRDKALEVLAELGEGDVAKGRQELAKWKGNTKQLTRVQAKIRTLQADKVEDSQQRRQLTTLEERRMDLIRKMLR